MTIKSSIQTVVQTITNIPQQVIRYIADATTRIFSPTDDNYPATGVQPFEGEPADKKHSET